MITRHALSLGSILCILAVGFSTRPVLPSASAPAQSRSMPVRVINRSQPILCAEKDNVSILFQARDVRHFTVEAAHPNYIHMLSRDSWDADWTNCDMSGDPVVPAQPRALKFYDDGTLSLIGYTYPTFWRKNDVPIHVAERIEPGLHLIQLWITDKGHAQEVLALYPPDGYMRVRPLPPAQLKAAVYGSSFLVGPIEEEAGRPLVNFKDLAFDPATRSFTLNYRDGSSATLKIRTADDERVVLDVDFSRPMSGQRPFAALRSMYVTEFNADAARIAVREPNAKAWREEHIMRFSGANASDIWTGRLVPSRHNTSAPDMVFHHFTR